MDAMILAAGLGTRLGELTRDRPKALVEVAGVPMLERVATRLIDAGADRLIVNTHHHAEQIAEFLDQRRGFGVEYLISNEPDHPLDTGGGLAKARDLFRRDSPFFLHNADIVSEIPLRRMFDRHTSNEQSPLVTVAVMQRPSSRYLLFDEAGLLGRVDEGKGVRLLGRPSAGEIRRLAFGGVHVISPDIFRDMPDDGVYSILDVYLEAIGRGKRVEPFEVQAAGWFDIGKPDQLAEAERAVTEGKARR